MIPKASGQLVERVQRGLNGLSRGLSSPGYRVRQAPA
jgi:hypothetical protein